MSRGSWFTLSRSPRKMVPGPSWHPLSTSWPVFAPSYPLLDSTSPTITAFSPAAAPYGKLLYPDKPKPRGARSRSRCSNRKESPGHRMIPFGNRSTHRLGNPRQGESVFRLPQVSIQSWPARKGRKRDQFMSFWRTSEFGGARLRQLADCRLSVKLDAGDFLSTAAYWLNVRIPADFPRNPQPAGGGKVVG